MHLTIFNFESNEIRTALIDGAVWFVAKDLAETLDYAETAKALLWCKQSTVQGDVNKINGLHPSTKWIPESDMYRLIMKSTKTEAEKFQDWIAEDVLPSIRKTGTFSVKPLSQLEILAQSAQALVEQERRLIATQQQVEALSERVENISVDLRNGVPHGFISKANAHRQYSKGLSRAIFDAVMTEYGVLTQKYVHSENGHSVLTFAYEESEIEEVIQDFIDDAIQKTPAMCYSKVLNRRFGYIKP